MDIHEKTVVVVGGASGLGAATCKAVVKAGGRVAVCDRNQAQAAALASEIGAQAYALDVCESASIELAIEKIQNQYGAIHAVVNCAGICPAERVLGKKAVASLELFNEVLQINLSGTFNVLRLFAAAISQQAPFSEEGERGVIINTASIAAFEGQTGQAAYSASKAGVIGMMLPIARELKRVGIRVMTIAPGVFATPMMDSLGPEVADELAASVPFPSRLGQASEFADLALHIIDNSYLNAETIRLDGGLRMS